MPRPQFRLSTLLWITLAVACWFGGFFGGRAVERRAEERRLEAAYELSFQNGTHGIKVGASLDTWDELIREHQQQEDGSVPR